MKQIWVAECEEGVVFVEKTDTLFKVLEFGDVNDGDFEDENVKQLEQLQDTLAYYGCGTAVETPMRSGEFFPRIWRGNLTPSPRQLGTIDTAHWVSTVRATRMLYSRLGALFAAIEPHQMQDQTYGLLQREILILACTEVESAWRTILEQNNATPKGGKPGRWSTSDYVRLLKPMRLDEWSVSLSSHHAYRHTAPFKEWDAANPTKSLLWYDAYNAVKHGREENLRQATYGATIDSVAAAFIMTVAQFGLGHLATSKDGENMHFHPDEFTIERQPRWDGTERYIPPTNMGIERGAWIGHERWERTWCPALDQNAKPSP